MKHLLSILIGILFLINCNSQQIGDRVTKTSVVIYNNSNYKISILLGVSTLKMDTFKLKEKEVWLSPVYNRDPTIKLQTQNKVIAYQLKLDNNYMIFWNDKKKYWDIQKTKKKQ